MSKQKKIIRTDNLAAFKRKLFDILNLKADKSEIPTSLPANGGNADTVNGHTVNFDIPANAKFTDTTYSNATTTSAGLMSADDKTKLNNLSNIDVSSKMDKDSAICTSSFSMYRKAGTTVGSGSVTLGNGCEASRLNCFASGYYTTATGDHSCSQGFNTTASGAESHAEGYMTAASGAAAHTEGSRTIAIGLSAHAEGHYFNNITDIDGNNMANTTASGTGSHAEGANTYADKNASHAEGCGTKAINDQAHAEGLMTKANGKNSHAEGQRTTASAEDAHAEGYMTVASQEEAHAEGTRTLASGYAAHAEGTYRSNYTDSSGVRACRATNRGSHAEGISTQATADAAHAEGENTQAKGLHSHAEGINTLAFSTNAHAEGEGTIANNDNIHVCGRYNGDVIIGNTGDAFIIGNGTSDTSRSNAFRVTFNGYTYGFGMFNSSGADYAEFIKPWFDDNPNNEDRIGYFVTIKNGKLYFAEPNDYIVGITSGNPCVVGNSDENWLGRWQRDEFNRVIMEDVEEEINEVINEKTGEFIRKKTGKIIKNARFKENPNYDSTQQYIERKDRPEWDYVGMIGVLPLRDDGTCIAGGFAKCGENGIATAADGWDCHKTFFVIERINENVISVEMR